MSKNRYNSLTVIVALPLLLFLWQGSSCRSSDANSNAGPNMNANVKTVNQSRDLRGTWGGQGIAMEVTDAGATIEYDCAHGRITERIAPGGDGKFEAKGVFVRERGGPQRQGEDNEEPAAYAGSIKDEMMTLTAKLAQTNESVGTFTLTQGKTGRIRKCL
ncbi:MAG TPA: hypothetical protein VJV21_00875 [Pyrinomonadaceae bacterium]|nr:hypothetical protein [Pyrinomonadaceae bacterium]